VCIVYIVFVSIKHLVLLESPVIWKMNELIEPVCKQVRLRDSFLVSCVVVNLLDGFDGNLRNVRITRQVNIFSLGSLLQLSVCQLFVFLQGSNFAQLEMDSYILRNQPKLLLYL